jgi:hypothetical protein
VFLITVLVRNRLGPHSSRRNRHWKQLLPSHVNLVSGLPENVGVWLVSIAHERCTRREGQRVASCDPMLGPWAQVTKVGSHV